MGKLDLSEVDFNNASLTLKTFMRNHTQTIKKSSVNKASVEKPSGEQLIGELRTQTIAEEENSQARPAYTLTTTGYQTLCQIEFWLQEQKDTIDGQYMLSYDQTPVAIKTFELDSISKPVCLLSGQSLLTKNNCRTCTSSLGFFTALF